MELEMLPYKNIELKTKKVLEQLTVSSRVLAELKGYSNTIPNMHILINAVTIKEAKDSSAIENIVTTHDDIYKVLPYGRDMNKSKKRAISIRIQLLKYRERLNIIMQELENYQEQN